MVIRSRIGFRLAGIGCIILFALTGCGHHPKATAPEVSTKSRTELAVEAISDGLLQKCAGMPPLLPDNTVGDLLADGAAAMVLLAECKERNAALVDYLAPVVEAERSRK